MFPLLRIWRRFVRALRRGWADDAFRALLGLTVALLLVGMTFYHFVEGWSWLDSLYFAVITLSTVGYGDFSPQQPLGKAFTLVYVLAGLGVLASFIGALAGHMIEDVHEEAEARRKKDEAGEQ